MPHSFTSAFGPIPCRGLDADRGNGFQPRRAPRLRAFQCEHAAHYYLAPQRHCAGDGAAVGRTLPAGWMLVDSLDLNGDGKPDFLLSNASTRQTALWYLNGAAYSSSVYGPYPAFRLDAARLGRFQW